MNGATWNENVISISAGTWNQNPWNQNPWNRNLRNPRNRLD